MQHIKSLMANLDSEIICTVQNNMSELRKFVNVPDEGEFSDVHRGSYMSAHVLLNLNRLRKSYKMRSLWGILSLFRTKFNKINNTGA